MCPVPISYRYSIFFLVLSQSWCAGEVSTNVSLNVSWTDFLILFCMQWFQNIIRLMQFYKFLWMSFSFTRFGRHLSKIGLIFAAQELLLLQQITTNMQISSAVDDEYLQSAKFSHIKSVQNPRTQSSAPFGNQSKSAPIYPIDCKWILPFPLSKKITLTLLIQFEVIIFISFRRCNPFTCLQLLKIWQLSLA